MIDWDTQLERIALIKELRENVSLRKKIQQMQNGFVQSAMVLKTFLKERERRQCILQKVLDVARKKKAGQEGGEGETE